MSTLGIKGLLRYHNLMFPLACFREEWRLKRSSKSKKSKPPPSKKAKVTPESEKYPHGNKSNESAGDLGDLGRFAYGSDGAAASQAVVAEEPTACGSAEIARDEVLCDSTNDLDDVHPVLVVER